MIQRHPKRTGFYRVSLNVARAILTLCRNTNSTFQALVDKPAAEGETKFGTILITGVGDTMIVDSKNRSWKNIYLGKAPTLRFCDLAEGAYLHAQPAESKHARDTLILLQGFYRSMCEDEAKHIGEGCGRAIGHDMICVPDQLCHACKVVAGHQKTIGALKERVDQMEQERKDIQVRMKAETRARQMENLLLKQPFQDCLSSLTGYVCEIARLYSVSTAEISADIDGVVSIIHGADENEMILEKNSFGEFIINDTESIY